MRLVPSILRKASNDSYRQLQASSLRSLSTFQEWMVEAMRSSALSLKWYPVMIVFTSTLTLGAMMQTLSSTLFGFSFLPVVASGLCLILFLLPWQVLAEKEKEKRSNISQQD